MKRLVVLLLAVSALSFAADVLPSSYNGKLVREYLDAFNAGESAMRAYYQAHPNGPPVEERLERYRRTKADFGSLTPQRFVGEDAGSLTVVVRTGDGRDLSLTCIIAGDKPQIAGLRIVPAEEEQGPTTAGPPEDEKAVLRKVQDLVEHNYKAGEFSGTVLIARGSDVVWQAAYGQANQEKNIPNQLDTRFDVGSIAKTFTRVAIGQLIEQGKLKFSDKAGAYLPNYPNPEVREQVTIEQLLTMRSGIGDFFGEKLRQTPKDKIRTLQDYVPLFAADPLLFPPGSKQQYSNGGYIVLGLIIESLTGQSYYDFVEKNVFERAGMKNSAFGLRSDGDPKLAVGYTTQSASGEEGPPQPRHPNLGMLPARGNSAGSAQSTVGDLLLFSQALAAGKLGSSSTLGKVDVHPDGMGIAGGAPGLNAVLETGVQGAGPASYSVAVMSNFDPPSAEKLSREIRGILRSAK